MNERERAFAALGFEYAEGIDLARVVVVPTTGREIRRKKNGKWEAQPWDDNYWQEFDDLLDAAKFATKPKPAPAWTAVRVDYECNADEFWTALREQMPGVARALESRDSAVVSPDVYESLSVLGAFHGEPSPLIDYGSEGDGYLDVVTNSHTVIEIAE